MHSPRSVEQFAVETHHASLPVGDGAHHLQPDISTDGNGQIFYPDDTRLGVNLWLVQARDGAANVRLLDSLEAGAQPGLLCQHSPLDQHGAPSRVPAITAF